MNHWSGNKIRSTFLEYFSKNGHTTVASASLVPSNDPTLLFTNAGMVPFKDVFLGVDNRPYNKATSSQRCVRAGGKHNDLENVGYTLRHHTFFEMLGNFSFGAYFKREAIEYAWDFLTSVLGLDESKLWVTIHEKDLDSEVIWLEEMEINPKRFSRCGDKDNFWSMGDIGPCGYCTEIFYDHGPNIAGGPPGSPDADGDRYVEIWNLVFMEFDRNAEGERISLPRPCVDTGMGLERITAIMQGSADNYQTDLFDELFNQASALVGCKDFKNKSLRVIVDHIRSSSFLIIDGVMPSNEGRGYVLRRIIRRALRHGYKLGQNQLFFYKLVSALVHTMGDVYPELKSAKSVIEKILKKEEESFASALFKGMKVFELAVSKLDGDIIPGDVVFTLYDTYGFPPDLTSDMARERNLSIDKKGFDRAMTKQRRQSQAAQQFNADSMWQVHINGSTEFVGYDNLEFKAKVTTILHDFMPVTELHEGQDGFIVLDQTPFYAESGGQVGDSGCLIADGIHFQVVTTQKHGSSFLHVGRMLSGTLHNNSSVMAKVAEMRADIAVNHSATHLLHAALRQVLGDHVSQKGSLVESDRLRFDFSHTGALTQNEIYKVEDLVNSVVRKNTAVQTETMSFDDAKENGAIALFGEKYADDVRVISMGDFSVELCGGTHVDRTGDIGMLVITSDSACSAGVRRIEALTGSLAFNWMRQKQQAIFNISKQLKVNETGIIDKLELLQQDKSLLQQLKVKQQQASLASTIESLVKKAVDINGISVIASVIDGVPASGLRDALDSLRDCFKTYALVLAHVEDGKVKLVSAVSKDTTGMFKAGALLSHVAKQVDGKGGGRPDFAQGGGTNPSNINEALESVAVFVAEHSVGGS